MEKKKLCINYDWVQIWSREPEWVEDAASYEDIGYKVINRGYGTRVFGEKITLIGKDGIPFVEIARKPLSSVHHPKSCQIRLLNHYCYTPDPLGDLVNFINDAGFWYKNGRKYVLSRLDIAVDFTTFYDNLGVFEFIHDYMRDVIFKVNQNHLSAFGTDSSHGKLFTTLKWGSASSMVSTKLYLKTLEMAQVKEKPYIRQAWVDSGLLSDSLDETDVWRLEFSLGAECKHWVLDGNKKILFHNTLESWRSGENRLAFFSGLVKNYFNFRYRKDGYKGEPIRLFALSQYECYKPRPLDKFRDTGRSELLLMNRLDRLAECYSGCLRETSAIISVKNLVRQIYAVRKEGGSLSKIALINLDSQISSEVEMVLHCIIEDMSRTREEHLSADICLGLYHQYVEEVVLAKFCGNYSETIERYSNTAVHLSNYCKNTDEGKALIQELSQCDLSSEKWDKWRAEEIREELWQRSRVYAKALENSIQLE